MECRRYQTDLNAAAAGEALTAESRRALETHLSLCAECAARLKRRQQLLASVDNVLAESADREPSSDLVRGIERRLADPPPRPALSFGAVAAAALALAIAAGTWILRGKPRSTARPAPAARTLVAQPAANPESIAAAAPAPAAAIAPDAARHANRRRLPRSNPLHFQPVKTTPERDAVVRLYRLLESGQIGSRELDFAPCAGDKPIGFTPLATDSLTIRPLEIDSPVNAAGAPPAESSFPEPGAQAPKEMNQ